MASAIQMDWESARKGAKSKEKAIVECDSDDDEEDEDGQCSEKELQQEPLWKLQKSNMPCFISSWLLDWPKCQYFR